MLDEAEEDDEEEDVKDEGIETKYEMEELEEEEEEDDDFVSPLEKRNVTLPEERKNRKRSQVNKMPEKLQNTYF